MLKLLYWVVQCSPLGTFLAVWMWSRELVFCILQGLLINLHKAHSWQSFCYLLLHLSKSSELRTFFPVSDAVFNISKSVQAAQGHWILNSLKFLCQVSLSSWWLYSPGMFLSLLLTWRMSCHLLVKEDRSLFFFLAKLLPYCHHEALMGAQPPHGYWPWHHCLAQRWAISQLFPGTSEPGAWEQVFQSLWWWSSEILGIETTSVSAERIKLNRGAGKSERAREENLTFWVLGTSYAWGSA